MQGAPRFATLPCLHWRDWRNTDSHSWTWSNRHPQRKPCKVRAFIDTGLGVWCHGFTQAHTAQGHHPWRQRVRCSVQGLHDTLSPKAVPGSNARIPEWHQVTTGQFARCSPLIALLRCQLKAIHVQYAVITPKWPRLKSVCMVRMSHAAGSARPRS
jgi:hypothetical protein